MGHAGQARHLDPVALVGPARRDPSQEDHLVIALPHEHAVVLDTGHGTRQVSQLVIVGRKERTRLDLRYVVQVFGDRPRDTDPVKGTGPAADLVEHDQATRRRVIQDIRRLLHLHHEGAASANQIVAGPDAGEHPVDDADFRFIRRHK